MLIAHWTGFSYTSYYVCIQNIYAVFILHSGPRVVVKSEWLMSNAHCCTN